MMNKLPDGFVTIRGFEYRYGISRNGVIWDCKREICVSQYIDKGYLCVNLTDEFGKQHKKMVHRLVATAYIPNIHNFPDVNHIDENKFNNTVENLEWCSRKQNCRHSAHKHRGIDNRNQYIKCVETNQIFSSTVRLARYLKCNQCAVIWHLDGKIPTLKGLHFERISEREAYELYGTRRLI